MILLTAIELAENGVMSLSSGERSALLNARQTHRYSLRIPFGEPLLPLEDPHTGFRSWESAVLFVMLNPSTADHAVDDPTIRRCKAFAIAWGFRQLRVCNLFSLRSPDPSVLKKDPSAEGDPVNISCIRREALCANFVVAAWGARGTLRGRAEEVCQTALGGIRVHHLGLTSSGEPRHPLYLRADTQPKMWLR